MTENARRRRIEMGHILANYSTGRQLVTTVEQLKFTKAFSDHAGQIFAGRVLTAAPSVNHTEEYRVSQLSVQYHKSTRTDSRVGSITATLCVRLRVKGSNVSTSTVTPNQVCLP